MVLTSDIILNIASFDDANITPAQHALNSKLQEQTNAGERWFDVGAEKYRQMRANGETPFPGRTVLPEGKDIQVQSRDANRDIPCRVFLPSSGKVTGTFMHIHGGGWVLQSQADFDPLLKRTAEEAAVAVVSVGYRLAPEYPFPAAPNDCYDVADWLAANAEHHFGAPLRFISGESAGGHLTVLSALHLLSLPQPYLGIKAIVCHYGVYSLTGLPSWNNFKQELMLSTASLFKYRDAFVPQHQMDPGFLQKPEVSPFFADLNIFKGQLPAAFFTVGTADPLLDDTIVMGTKWMSTGADTIVKVYPGQPHGFTLLPTELSPTTEETFHHTLEFLRTRSGFNVSQLLGKLGNSVMNINGKPSADDPVMLE